MPSAIFLTEKDKELLERVLQKVRKQPEYDPIRSLNERQKMIEVEGHTSPEVYIALAPEEGIPEIERFYGEDNNIFGTAICDIYRIVDTVAFPVTDVDRLVHNPYDFVIPRYLDKLPGASGTGDVPNWFPVHKTKYGTWIAGISQIMTGLIEAAAAEDIDIENMGDVRWVNFDSTDGSCEHFEPTLITFQACNLHNTRVWDLSPVLLGWSLNKWKIIKAYSATMASGSAVTNGVTGDTISFSVTQYLDGNGPVTQPIQVYVLNGPVLESELYHILWNDSLLRWEISTSGDVKCTTIHIPSTPSPGIYSHLYVSDRETVGGTVHDQTEWTEQGIDGILYVAHCNLVDCFTITVQKGLITDVSGPVTDYYDPPAGDLGAIVNPEVFAKTECGTAFG